jgi:hypothetical protein
MLTTLRGQLNQFAHLLQAGLFPAIEQETGEISETARKFISTLAMLPLHRFVPAAQGWNGRPAKDRLAIARAFVAKAVYNFPTTRDLIDRLQSDAVLRRICGWDGSGKQVPHESSFSRAFSEFARMEFPQFVHEALIRDTHQNQLIGHICRDSTKIEARERFPVTKEQVKLAKALKKQVAQAKREQKAKAKQDNAKAKSKKKRLPKAERPPKDLTRIERQRTMTLSAMLEELPRNCSIGTKVSSNGYQQYWRGYKLHWDVADGQIPISMVLTGASVHDSQVAIPLATITSQRVTSLYDLMDSAYDAPSILEHSIELGHKPIVDPANRGRKTKNVIAPGKPPRELSQAEAQRYKQRTIVERANGRLKDEFGGRSIRVRGAVKVMAHLMFGVLALTVDQLLRLPG